MRLQNLQWWLALNDLETTFFLKKEKIEKKKKEFSQIKKSTSTGKGTNSITVLISGNISDAANKQIPITESNA